MKLLKELHDMIYKLFNKIMKALATPSYINWSEDLTEEDLYNKRSLTLNTWRKGDDA